MEEENFFEMIDHLKDLVDKDEPVSGDKHSAKWPMLYQISTLLSATTVDLERILESIVDVAIELTDASRGFLILFDDKGDFDVQIGRGAGKLPLTTASFEFSRSIVEETVKHGDALILPNLKDMGFSDASSVIDLALTSAMCIPLIQRNRVLSASDKRRKFEQVEKEVLGVLYVDSAREGNSFDKEDLNFFRTLANQATAALINTRLYLQATTDPLSNLYNRRQFEISLKEVLRRCEAHENPFSLLMMDIDHFKKINDNFGHQVGDDVIVEVAKKLKRNVRAMDICARYGGEEFCVILSNTNSDGASIIAEKIRKALEETVWPHDGLRTTISLGIATWPDHGKDLEGVVKRADQALYASKEGGRNRYTIWSSEIGTTAQRTDKLAGIITGNYARDYRNITMVFETIFAVNSTMELHELLKLAVDKVLEAVEGERSALMLFDDEGQLRTHICRDRFGNNLEIQTKFSQSIPRKVVASGESIYILDAEEDEDAFTESIAELSLRAVMCVPLIVRENTIGVLYVDSRHRAQGFSENDLPFLSALAYQIAFAIENARMRERLMELEKQA